MTHSLNEIEALSKRAARGAGLSWGMAEEAGRASRWLASHDLAGVTLLAGVLTQNDKTPHCDVAPASMDGPWAAPEGPLCPLVSGATLNDNADLLKTGQTIEMEEVSHPLIMVPFAAWAALHIAAPVRITWQDLCIETDGNGIWIDDPKGQIDTAGPVSLACARAPQRDDPATAPGHRGTPHPADWARLTSFAHRTYAPATEESRLLGAGAGVSDND